MKEIEKECAFCGKNFITTSKIRQCCSTVCSHKLSALKTKQMNKNFKRIYNINDNFLKNDIAEKYYFLGLMASDGCLSPNTKTISICQSGEEGLKLLKYINDILNSDYKILSTQPKIGKRVYGLYYRSEALWKDLNDNNVVPKKTYIYTIPLYILNDTNKLKSFLIGYIDGDGSIGVYKNMLVISFVCSNAMCEQLKKLDLFKRALFYKKGKVVEIRFNGVKAVEFGNFLYKDYNLFKSYKYKKFFEYNSKMLDISPKMKYNLIQHKLFEALNNNPNLNCMQYAKENNLHFQYVYYNRKKWREQYG